MTTFDERRAYHYAAWSAAFRFVTAAAGALPLSHLAATRTEGDHRMSYVETKQDQGTYLYATHGHNMPAGKVAVVGAHEVGEGWHDAFVDREDAVRVRDALTNAIDAHDAREAAKTTEARRAAVAAFNVGDRVEVHGWNSNWDGPGTVTHVTPESRFPLSVQSDAQPAMWSGGFSLEHVRHLPTPNYAAMAATFKPGDLAIVGDNPGTRADGSGFVEDYFHGATVNVLAHNEEADYWKDKNADELVRVQAAAAAYESNYIHVAHLTRAKAVPA